MGSVTHLYWCYVPPPHRWSLCWQPQLCPTLLPISRNAMKRTTAGNKHPHAVFVIKVLYEVRYRKRSFFTHSSLLMDQSWWRSCNFDRPPHGFYPSLGSTSRSNVPNNFLSDCDKMFDFQRNLSNILTSQPQCITLKSTRSWPWDLPNYPKQNMSMWMLGRRCLWSRLKVVMFVALTDPPALLVSSSARLFLVIKIRLWDKFSILTLKWHQITESKIKSLQHNSRSLALHFTNSAHNKSHNKSEWSYH